MYLIYIIFGIIKEKKLYNMLNKIRMEYDMRILNIEDLPHYTYNDYKIWEGRWELVDGIPYFISPSPMWEHQNIRGDIYLELKKHLKKNKNYTQVLAKDWKISNDTIVCPDNSVVSGDMKSKFIETIPEIIFEVLSPLTKKIDRNTKYNLFQNQGVKYYIIVEPKGSFAEVYKLINGFYELQGEFTNEKYKFDMENYSIKFNFLHIFNK